MEDADPLLARQLGVVRAWLHALLEPLPLLLVLDVEVLDAERPAVRRLEARDELTERGGGAAAEARALDHPSQVGFREAQLRGLEKRMTGGLRRERIQMRDQVAELAVGMHEVGDLEYGFLLGGCDDRRRAPIAVDRELEAGEEESPPLVDRVGILLIAPILLGDVVLVGERDAVESAHSVPFSSAPDGAPPGARSAPDPRARTVEQS